MRSEARKKSGEAFGIEAAMADLISAAIEGRRRLVHR
jgi:hypothetical protein